MAPPVLYRTNHSLLRGCRSPEEICRSAREQGSGSVAVADVNNFYGLIRFLKAAKREGLRPVAGVHVEQGGSELFTALVLDRKGFSRACALLSGLLTSLPPRGGPCEPPGTSRAPGGCYGESPAFDAVSDLATAAGRAWRSSPTGPRCSRGSRAGKRARLISTRSSPGAGPSPRSRASPVNAACKFQQTFR